MWPSVNLFNGKYRQLGSLIELRIWRETSNKNTHVAIIDALLFLSKAATVIEELTDKYQALTVVRFR